MTEKEQIEWQQHMDKITYNQGRQAGQNEFNWYWFTKGIIIGGCITYLIMKYL